MGHFSIQPIIRLVVVGIVLLSERILLENAVVGSWAQLLAVRSTIPRRKLEKVPVPAQFMLISAIYAYQPKFKNSAVYA